MRDTTVCPLNDGTSCMIRQEFDPSFNTYIAIACSGVKIIEVTTIPETVILAYIHLTSTQDVEIHSLKNYMCNNIVL